MRFRTQSCVSKCINNAWRKLLLVKLKGYNILWDFISISHSTSSNGSPKKHLQQKGPLLYREANDASMEAPTHFIPVEQRSSPCWIQEKTELNYQTQQMVQASLRNISFGSLTCLQRSSGHYAPWNIQWQNQGIRYYKWNLLPLWRQIQVSVWGCVCALPIQNRDRNTSIWYIDPRIKAWI